MDAATTWVDETGLRYADLPLSRLPLSPAELVGMRINVKHLALDEEQDYSGVVASVEEHDGYVRAHMRR